MPRRFSYAAVAALAATSFTAQAQSAASVVNMRSRRLSTVTDSVLVHTMGTLAITNRKIAEGSAKAQLSQENPLEARRQPYIGAQLSYAFGTDSRFDSNMLASGDLLYTVYAPPERSAQKYQFFLPVRGNISSLKAPIDEDTQDKVGTLVGSQTGLRAGIEPYVLLPEAGKFVHPFVFGFAGWSLSSAKDNTDSTRYLALGRLSLGLGLSIGAKEDGRYPMVIEFSAGTATFVDQDYRKVLGDTASRRVRTAVTSITVPMGNNLGLLTEAVSGAGRRPIWRMGLILMGTGK